MTEQAVNLEGAQARVERAEQEDDQTRLQTLEQLHADLEAELERDAPGAETKPGP